MSKKGNYVGGHTVYTMRNLSRGERLTLAERTQQTLEIKSAALAATKRNIELGVVSAKMRRRFLRADQQVEPNFTTEEDRLAYLAQIQETRLSVRREAKAKKKAERRRILARDNPPSLDGRIVVMRDDIVTETFFNKKK